MVHALYARLIGLLEPEVQSLGFDLIEIEVALTRRGGVLRLYIDGPSGVLLDDCERVSRAVAGVLDVEDPIRHAYQLEVSSPGPDRPLRRQADFERYLGHLVRLRFGEPVAGKSRLTGRLGAIQPDGIALEADGTAYRIPWENIDQARLVPDY
jgi:ribosome maturation factor RimP